MEVWTVERLKGLRHRHGEIQSVFCHRLGVSVDTLQNWEQGRSAVPRPVGLLLDRLEEDFEADHVRPLPVQGGQVAVC